MTTTEFLNNFTRQKRNSPTDWHVPCPAHDDNLHDPGKWSLHITVREDRLLLHCFAGCASESILRALGLKPSDLFFDNGGGDTNGHGRVQGAAPAPAGWTRVTTASAGRAPQPEPAEVPAPIATIAAFSALKKISMEFLLAEGWFDTPRGIAIPYKQRDGSAWRVRGRTSLKPGEGFVWDGQKDKPLIPYGRHHLDEAIDKDGLWLVEGESDAVTAWYQGLQCLGIPGNLVAKALSTEDLAGIDKIWIVVESGQSGIGFTQKLRERLRDLDWKGTAKMVVHLPTKDLSDLHVADPEGFLAAVERAKASAEDLFAQEAVQAPMPTLAADDLAPVHLSTLLTRVAADIESGVKPSVIPTPFPLLNEMLDGGFARQELTFIGARASVGKSALALQVAIEAAKHGHGVLIVSREMGEIALARRIVAQQARVFAKSLRRNEVADYDKGLIQARLPGLMHLPVYVTDAVKNITEITELVERFSGTAPLGLLLVDYLQLVGAPKGIGERRFQVEAVSKILRDLAIQFNIAVVAISSLNRALGDEGRPSMASLRESSELEHDADVVMLLHREFGKRETECIIAKQRNGEQGTVHLLFEWEYTAFVEG